MIAEPQVERNPLIIEHVGWQPHPGNGCQASLRSSVHTHDRKGSMIFDQSGIGVSWKNGSLKMMSGRVTNAPACPAVRIVCRSDEPVKYTPATTVVLPTRGEVSIFHCVRQGDTHAIGRMSSTLAGWLGEGEFCRTHGRDGHMPSFLFGFFCGC
jgi:hypothetical protein